MRARELRRLANKREHLPGAAQVKGTMIQAHLNWLKEQGVDPTTALATHLTPARD